MLRLLLLLLQVAAPCAAAWVCCNALPLLLLLLRVACGMSAAALTRAASAVAVP
jgi:hypothetical protein